MTDLTPDLMLRAAQEVAQQFPETTLVRNAVGNLSIIDAAGEYVGWVDLHTGEVSAVR